MLLARTPSQIGAAIRRRRKALKLSQSRLGEKCGLRQETISLLETGNPAVRLDTLLGVLAALDLELQIAPRSKRDVGELEDHG
ncbi:MAG: helix-turn-helix domain-containing protein [Beijerinckiaceae bacterium]